MLVDRESTDFVGTFGALARDMMSAMLDQSQDCVKILDLGGRVDFMNRNGRCVMEIDDFCSIAGASWPSLWPEDARDPIERSLAEARDGRSSRFEAFCPTAKGTPKWWDVTVSPVRDAEGASFAILSISRDVTAQRLSAESMETMAHEMRHRLRNAYAVASAITLASAREQPDHRDFADDLAQRFTSLSVAQSQLLENGGGQSLAQLVPALTGAFDRGRGLVALGELPALVLGEQQARLVALVLGELCTNSVKHGALRDGRGVLVTCAHGEGSMWLIWTEPVVGVIKATDGGSGFGLMERMARAHGGRFEAQLGGEELIARLEVPFG